MARERVPDGIPVTQREWDMLSARSRRWFIDVTEEIRDLLRRAMLAEELGGVVPESGLAEQANLPETRQEEKI